MRKTREGGNKADGAGRTDPRSRELDAFGRAVSFFNAGKFEQAKPLFDQLAGSADRSVADAARSRSLMCERRMRSASETP